MLPISNHLMVAQRQLSVIFHWIIRCLGKSQAFTMNELVEKINTSYERPATRRGGRGAFM
nr:unnamed protein product [Digitaria exilis]